MKKFYYFFFALLINGSTAFSQSPLTKTELLPDQSNRDSRFSVQATVMDNDTWCKVTWPDPVLFWELTYDDGEADDFFLWSSAGNLSANKFHPYGYPYIVTGGRIYVGDGSFPGPFLGTSFRVLVFDDDGTDGLPGTALDSIDVTVDNYEWVEFEGLTTSFTEGDFYLAMKQMAPSPNTAPVGVDLTNPTYFKSYVHYVGAPDWVLAPLQDFMIRAWIEGYNEPEREIDYFQVARFSNFNPYGSPLLGDTTILADTVYPSEYDDYAWDNLTHGLYAYGVKTHFTGGEWSDYDVSNNVTHIYFLYPPSCLYQSGYLIFCPPHDSNGDVPPGIVAYNLYRDGNFVGYIPNIPEPAPNYILIDGMQPGTYNFGLNAEYDLTSYGYPGSTGESMKVFTDFVVRYGYPLPFLEQWNLGTFGTNNWITDGPNWTINGQEGNPDPSAEFSWDPILTNYQSSLTSYPLQADSLTEGKIYLDFDIKLNSVDPTGTESMLIQVWNWDTQLWETAETLSNIDGSFDWMAEHLDITPMAMGQIFKIRFSAQGENSINILGWLIDNIHVYRACSPPENLSAHLDESGMNLSWDYPSGTGFEDQWIHWDDGEVSGNSIFAGYDYAVAARWTPNQLTNFEGASITQIAFVPGEVQAATYRVRVWSGELAANLLIDQDVVSPVVNQWNYITLNTPVPIDITQELWVGYQIHCVTGYPAGVDDGPAIDGYGNWYFFGHWQTILEINPDLDFNWSIKAYIIPGVDPDSVATYAIYRSDDGNPYFLRDYSDERYYTDDSTCFEALGNYFEYKVTALYIEGADTCESDYSNTSGDVCEGINDSFGESDFNIYPNPCNDFLKIESSEEIEFISLYNSFGELLLKKVVHDKQLEIPFSAYSAGVYLIRVESDGRVISKKVMVVH
jgi:hypothetical protein